MVVTDADNRSCRLEFNQVWRPVRLSFRSMLTNVSAVAKAVYDLSEVILQGVKDTGSGRVKATLNEARQGCDGYCACKKQMLKSCFIAFSFSSCV